MKHEGLYDSANDHDSCGVGFIARLDAAPRHDVIADALQALRNLEHRGALGGDTTTGDGAGLLLQIPDRLFRETGAPAGADLPPPGEYAAGMVFLPSGNAAAEECERILDATALEAGMQPLGWRDVPTDNSSLGELARATCPRIRQLFIARGAVPAAEFERKLYVVRRIAEKRIAALDHLADCHIATLSSRTMAYKGMLTATQLSQFYPDLRDPRMTSAFALIHQRYSTNTFPMWRLAQPLRALAHNGEISSLRGNFNRMRGREIQMAGGLLGADVEKIKPIIQRGGSDSAMLDNVLELLLHSGRSLPHAMMMLVPEAWGTKYVMSEDKRAFYEYHAAVMEPWDGPAALVFTDGRLIGATLDRNGLRPARYTITRDGRVIMGSETGIIDIEPRNILSRGRLQPGRMFLVDLQQKRVIPDNEIKAHISRRRPYRRWVADNKIELRGLFAPGHVPTDEPDALLQKQLAFGFSQEELDLIIGPMSAHGQEPIGSMGDDTPLAVLSRRPRLLFDYFKQLFAQVTNPPIDPLREELVMSLMSFVGRERNLLEESPGHCRQLKLPHPILTPEDMARLRRARQPEIAARELEILFPANGGKEELAASLETLCDRAQQHVSEGAGLLILTDSWMDSKRAPIPSLLAVSAVHQRLLNAGLRTSAGIILDSGEPREVIHFAMLIAFGANAICPNVAFSAIHSLHTNGKIAGAASPESAMDNYVTALKKGLLKCFSRMGMSTIRSFLGSQGFEAIGIAPEVIRAYFGSSVSRVGGIGLSEIAQDARARHAAAFASPAPELPAGGQYFRRAEGERHLWFPQAISNLQRAVRQNDETFYQEYARLTDEQAGQEVTLRSLLKFRKTEPVPLDEVEPADAIIRRFFGAAMSLGSISPEAHEAVAIALNRLGARSNCGEGGEDLTRTKNAGEDASSRTRQIASGRFGVTTSYLMGAQELQIKIAQGAKPGEGGQLPGQKVTAHIARLRHTTPGVTLISPPPHHDIYSIEDLAQLIYDLRSVNPAARISVKLVSESGVGAIAAGVAKAGADAILIAGHDGGTGSSPLTAIKFTGLPWELGLSETQQTLMLNRLRDRVTLQVDGQLRTGRDLAIAALLGAEEFGFGTALLVALGCVLLRKCHLNNCATGIATQDPALRARFAGKPEHVERFLRFVANDFRNHMARLGFRSVAEMAGRADILEPAIDTTNPKTRDLDFSGILHTVPGVPRRIPNHPAATEDSLNIRVAEAAASAVESASPIELTLPILNRDRAVGATVSGRIIARWGERGLPEETVRLTLTGSAGQSLGAFLAPGVTIRLEGDSNDYVGKGMSGGRIVIVPPLGADFAPEENIIVGNVALYGATAGEIFINGIAGERFAVRNSGATAVVEGVGDHGCEYMTGGTVVVLGPTGYNFAAGMSGGIAYVYNHAGTFDTRCNLDMVDLESVWTEEDKSRLQSLLQRHARHTGSAVARRILGNWEAALPLFVKVMPADYRKSLERMRQAEDRDRESVSATEEVFDPRPQP